MVKLFILVTFPGIIPNFWYGDLRNRLNKLESLDSVITEKVLVCESALSTVEN